MNLEKKNFWSELENNFRENPEITEVAKNLIFKNILKMKNEKINLLITGATGSGKSSTINALFGIDVARVGNTPNPETMSIQKFDLDNLILWDSPGLGDSIEQDENHSKNIIKKLNEIDKNGKALIDLVLVLIDGSTRDMGTTYKLINDVIIKNIKDKDNQRILVAINQCDIAMKGQYWNEEKKEPENKLVEFLNEKVKSVFERIYSSTGVKVEPIFYSAVKNYNISKLLSFIIKATPNEKRVIYIDNINKNEKIWQKNDSNDYNDEIKKSFDQSLRDVAKGITAGASAGMALGSVIPILGTTAGGIIGGVLGGILGWFSE